MSKKNSDVILKNYLQDFEDFSEVYLKFKSSLNKIKIKSFVVALSGGPDSLALVALTRAYKINHKRNSKFYYILINHNLRKNSSKEANQVRLLLKKHKIRVNIFNNKIKIKKNTQSIARKIRYEMIKKFCQKKKAYTILTAHNLEDQVETFFIRLSRGSGLAGLSAMKQLTKLEGNIKLLRPLLEIKKIKLIKISKDFFGRYFNDPSNKNTKYLRTKIRNLKEPLLKSGINYDQIIKSIKNLASSKEVLDQYLDDIFLRLVKRSKKKILINYKDFNRLNDLVKIKILNKSIKILKKNYYDNRSKKVSNLINTLKVNKFKKASLGGCEFFRIKDDLCVKIDKE
tara:strand:+ start:1478 stop:2503 length:1026 start_codon:yes stop_codon:yes gene_type:complete